MRAKGHSAQESAGRQGIDPRLTGETRESAISALLRGGGQGAEQARGGVQHRGPLRGTRDVVSDQSGKLPRFPWTGGGTQLCLGTGGQAGKVSRMWAVRLPVVPSLCNNRGLAVSDGMFSGSSQSSTGPRVEREVSKGSRLPSPRKTIGGGGTIAVTQAVVLPQWQWRPTILNRIVGTVEVGRIPETPAPSSAPVRGPWASHSRPRRARSGTARRPYGASATDNSGAIGRQRARPAAVAGAIRPSRVGVGPSVCKSARFAC